VAAQGSCRWRRCGRWSRVGRRVLSGAAVAELVQHVSWLDLIGRYGDRLAAHKELQRFLSPLEDLVGRSLCTNLVGEAWRAAGTGLVWKRDSTILTMLIYQKWVGGDQCRYY
jgi:hypothetical protein